MLAVQEYLKSGKTFDDLHTELGIEVNRSKKLPLVNLNYNQTNSPKTHPIVRECRGLTLRSDDYSLVARSFWRFFNWGEVADEMPLFNWDKATAYEKIDGSLVKFYFFEGEWRVETRGSFADMPMFYNEWQAQYHNMPVDWTWKQGILVALNMKDLNELDSYLDRSCTYACEFCSLWNKVVKDYPKPVIYQLSRFVGEEEIGPKSVSCFLDVRQFPLRNADDVVKFVTAHEGRELEGCVVKDDALRRWKIKNPKYLSLHKMKGANGDALYHPKSLFPYIMEGEGDELLAVYPEVKDVFRHYKKMVDECYAQLNELYESTKHIENQKEFALAIVGKHKLHGLLFEARKHGVSLKHTWHACPDYVYKGLFK
jgi:hypothetical protein